MNQTKLLQQRNEIVKKLEGKVAVITGGSTGIGLATAKRFTSEGAHVYITGRRQSELDEAVTEIGDNAIGVQGDVSNLADLDRLYDKVKEQKGQIDILFANAGVAELVHWGRSRKPTSIRHSTLTSKVRSFTVQKAFH